MADWGPVAQPSAPATSRARRRAGLDETRAAAAALPIGRLFRSPLRETRMSIRLRSVGTMLALVVAGLLVTAATGCKKSCATTEACYEVPQ